MKLSYKSVTETVSSKMNIQNVSDKNTESEKFHVHSLDCPDRNLRDLKLSYKSVTETVSSQMNIQNVSDKNPGSENINVHSLDVLIEIFKI